MDAPKTGAGGNPRDCRDGTCPSDGAGADPAGWLQSLPLETDRFSRTSTTVEPLAARSHSVSAEFLASQLCRSHTGIKGHAREDKVPAHVLVVDDDPLTCELICEILRSAGMEANSVTDSAEAAERLTREKCHAVFLDMRMPPPNGVELARQVRTSRVNASTVIVM